jgi:hypothetical protein
MIMKTRISLVISGLLPALLLVFFLVSCGSKKGGGSAGTEGWNTSGVQLDGEMVSVAGVTFRPPSTWRNLGPSGMRQADYQLSPVGKDTDSATMSVFYFGRNQGGGVKDNIERWIGQMAEPNGEEPHKAAESRDFAVDSLQVHYVELGGIYSAPVGGMMSGQTVAKPDYRLAAAVVEAPSGNLFFKLTGPEATATDMIKGFRALLLGIKRTPNNS